MARSWFGDSTGDFVVEAAAEAGAPIRYVDGLMTLWDAETGGTQWDDLLVDGDAASIVPVRAGQYRFQGPDGVVIMWAEVDGGDRVLIAALGDVVAQAAASAAAALAAQAAAEEAMEAAEAVPATTDGLMTVVDADAGSDFRTQQDARLAASFGGMALLAAYTPLAPPYNASGDGVTDDTAALNALLDAAPEDSTIDLGGLSYAVTAALLWDKRVHLRNGRLIATDHRAAHITAAGVSWTNVVWERTTAVGAATTLAERSGVSVAAERFTAVDCGGTDANHAVLYLTNGACDGSRVLRGTYENSSARQNASLIYVAAGASENRDIAIEDIDGTGTGCPDGILVFDASKCRVRDNRLSSFRRLPTVTLTGWTLVTGNIYKTAERTDGNTRVIKDNGTQRTELTSTPTTPGTNQWGISGGFVYLNLGGTNPNSHTITSDSNSGYAVTFYATTNQYMCDNLVEANQIDDADGFGIYMQLAYATARNNTTRNNRLTNVCLTGVQDSGLPFAGIGWTGASDCLMQGDSLTTIGTSGTAVPGVYHVAGGSSSTCTGRIIGVTVKGANRSGFRAGSTGWRYSACQSDGNTLHGYEISAWSAALTILEYDGCGASGNTKTGLAADGSTFGGAILHINVNGGLYEGNTERGVSLNDVAGGSVSGGVMFRNNGSSSFQQLHIRGTSARVRAANFSMQHSFNGKGLEVDSGCTEITIGEYDVSGSFTTPYNLNGVTVRMAGGTGASAHYSGLGTPESVLTAPVGAKFSRRDGGAGTCLYVKESGTGNTGWVAK